MITPGEWIPWPCMIVNDTNRPMYFAYAKGEQIRGWMLKLEPGRGFTADAGDLFGFDKLLLVPQP
jgi:hypothetical protein